MNRESRARRGDQLVGVRMHTLIFDGEEWVCVCNRFRTVDLLEAERHGGFPDRAARLSAATGEPE